MALGSSSYLTRSRRTDFGVPWNDIASQFIPRSFKNALRLFEYLYDSFGTYRSAYERIISYFVTDLSFTSYDSDEPIGESERAQWEWLLVDVLSAIEKTKLINGDKGAYGNGFASLVVPTIRVARCPQCGFVVKLRELFANRTFEARWVFPHVFATCPKCKTGQGYRGKWELDDLPSDNIYDYKIKLWSPHEMEILFDPYSGDCEYVWVIGEDYKRLIREGNPFHLERVPLKVLEAMSKGVDIRFHDGVIYHMKEEALSGRKFGGWGISRIMYNLRQVWYIQMLRRYNEAIGMDYLIPMRIIMPDIRPSGGLLGAATGGDPFDSMQGDEFVYQIRRMVRQRRRDPASFMVSPFPLRYQVLGGEAKSLVPVDMLEAEYSFLLNDLGIPVEFYKGNLQSQGAPSMIRMMEMFWRGMVNDNNRFLQWIVDQMSSLLGWERVRVRFRRVTHVDDLQLQGLIFQLMGIEQVSPETVLNMVGLNWRQEQRQIVENKRFLSKLQAEVEEEMQQSAIVSDLIRGQDPLMQLGGAMQQDQQAAAGGVGAAPAGGAAPQPMMGMAPGSAINGTMSLDEMNQMAESIAMQMFQLPETVKLQQLRLLREQNKELYYMVRGKMQEIRNRANTLGGAMLLGQPGLAQQG